MSREPHTAHGGFSLIELMIVLTLIAVLLLLSIPTLGHWVADAKIRNTSESLLGAVRLAQSTAVSRSRTTVLVRTEAAPTWDAEASESGKNWYVRVLPLTGSDEEASDADLIQGTSIGTQNDVSIAGPAVLCFGSQGRLVSKTAKELDLDADCEVPSDDSTDPAVFDLTKGAGRALRLQVHLGGRARMCDPAKELSSTNPDGC